MTITWVHELRLIVNRNKKSTIAILRDGINTKEREIGQAWKQPIEKQSTKEKEINRILRTWLKIADGIQKFGRKHEKRLGHHVNPMVN